MTELFFETSEPENAVVPIPQALAHLPAGTYVFRGIMGSAVLRGRDGATLTQGLRRHHPEKT